MDVTWYSDNSVLESQRPGFSYTGSPSGWMVETKERRLSSALLLFRIKNPVSGGQMYDSLRGGQLCDVNSGHFCCVAQL